MAVALGILIALLALAGAIGLGVAALRQIRQLRTELDETQRQVNELTAVAHLNVVPPMPRARSGGLDDLRQRLRQAHAESDDPAS